MVLLKVLAVLQVICALGTYVQLIAGQELEEVFFIRELGISEWTNCGPSNILNVTNVSIPKRIAIPGKIKVSFSGELKVPLKAPLKIEVSVRRNVFGLWLKLPCVNGLGSCTYENICQNLEGLEEDSCPSLIVLSGSSCHCPIQPTTLDLPPTTLQLSNIKAPALLPNGEYQVQIQVLSENTLISCFLTTVTLKLE